MKSEFTVEEGRDGQTIAPFCVRGVSFVPFSVPFALF